jgi:hypothetical protein
METKKTTVVINNINSAPPMPGSTMPGNLLINSEPGKPNWFPRREWRSLLLGAGLTGEEPLLAFIGMTLKFEALTITQADIDAAIAVGQDGVKVVVKGREITYKKPGVHNVNLSLDWSNVDLGHLKAAAELGSAVMDIKAKLPGLRTAQQPTTSLRTPVKKVIELEPPTDNTNTGAMPTELDGVKQDDDGNYVNADGSPLTQPQQIALTAWVDAQTKVVTVP